MYARRRVGAGGDSHAACGGAVLRARLPACARWIGILTWNGVMYSMERSGVAGRSHLLCVALRTTGGCTSPRCGARLVQRIYLCMRTSGVPAREHAWILTAIGARWEFPDGAASLSGGARSAEHVRRGRPILGGLCV